MSINIRGKHIIDEAQVSDRALVFDRALISGKAQVSGEALVFDRAQVTGKARVSGKAVVSGEAQVSGHARVSGEAEVCGTAFIYGIMRSDGHCFTYLPCADGNWRVIAGCRYFTMQEARVHWERTRGGTPLGAETMVILDCLEKLRAVKPDGI